MPGRTHHQFDNAEIIASLRHLAKTRGEHITLPEFCAHLRISQSTLLRRAGRWQNLRAAAGLQRPRAPLPAEFSDEHLIAEYRRICRELGRPPRPCEFNRRSHCRYATIINRFGSDHAIHRRARVIDDYEEAFGTRLPGQDRPKLAWDEAWLRELWPRVRVAFALYSSDLRPQFAIVSPSPRFRGEGRGGGPAQPDSTAACNNLTPPDPACGFAPTGQPADDSLANPKSKTENQKSPLWPVSRPSHSPDLIFCAVHDWPTAPVPVLIAPDLLGDRAQQPPPPPIV